MEKLKLRRLILTAAAATIFFAVFFIARGSYVSDQLKNIVLPELSAATGRNATAEKMYINIFPLFIGAKGLTLSENGAAILHISSVKGYVGLTGLLRQEIVFNRLVLRKPEIKTSDAQIKDIVRSIEEYMKTGGKQPFKFMVKAIMLDDGKFAFNYKQNSFAGSGLHSEAVLDTGIPQISFKLRDLSSDIKGWPELKTEVNGLLALRKDFIDLRRLHIGLYGSGAEVSGAYLPDAGGSSFNVSINLFMKSLKKLFNLKTSGEGEVNAKGTLNLAREGLDSRVKPVLDIEFKGDFYIQTLLELLNVHEKVEGLVSLAGGLKGSADRLEGKGKMRLKSGNLFGVAVDDLDCRVAYENGVLSFKDAKGSLYNGRAEMEAAFALPWKDYYTLKVDFSGVDSPAVLNLINWRPEIPKGKVKGGISTAGSSFNPSGWFEYESSSAGSNVLGRVRTIKGSFSMRDDVITLNETDVSTRESFLRVDGDIDLASENLSLRILLKSSNVKDLTLPYNNELSASGDFSGTVTGKTDDPLITGTVRLSTAFYEKFPFGEITGTIAYKKEQLDIREMQAIYKMQGSSPATVRASGHIRFKDAAGLFDLKKPVYGLSVSMQNAGLESITDLVYKKPLPVSFRGRVASDFRITGPAPAGYHGLAHINEGFAEDFALGNASFSFSYERGALLFRNALIRKNKSSLEFEAGISDEGVFDFRASGKGILLGDIAGSVPAGLVLFKRPVKDLPIEGLVNIKAEGRGTIEKPLIKMDCSLDRGSLKGMDLGGGNLKASLNNRNLFFDAQLVNGKVSVSGKAFLKDDIPWTARLDVKPGRYDFIPGALLKDVPEDLMFNLKGHADMAGSKGHFSASAEVNQLNITLFGYSFSNNADIRFNIKDKNLSLPMFTLGSGNTMFKVNGNMEIGGEYDLVMEGGLALAPLKGLSRKIETLRGDAAFVFAITGKWDAPKVSGGVEVSNGLLSLKDVPYRISSVNVYFYVDENRIVIERFSGKSGGGDIKATGIAYLQKFKLKRFYVDAALKDIGVNISRDFSANFSGNILYKGDLEAQSLNGEVSINRAKYRERVEWKSWLLKAKAMEKPRAEGSVIERAALNIRVYGSDNIDVDNNIARASLKIDMLLRGTVSHPVFFGRVESKTGTVYFRNNEFRILNASADFSDPRRTNPVMGIFAETSIKGYKIRMNLEGQMDHFNLSLVSEPPLDEMDIFSLLTVGRVGKEIKGIEGGIGAGEATAFLTGRFQDVLEERVGSLIGFDRLEVDPYVSKTTGTVNPRVTVSKKMLGDRLYVTYSSTVSSTENDIIRLEYLLGKNMSLIGLRDEKGGVGGDIKFRFEFK